MEPRRKHLSSLADNLGSRVYAAQAEPPYAMFIVEMMWGCFGIDRSKIIPFMPRGLTPIAEGVALFAMWRSPFGWGLSPSTGGFIAVPVNEYTSPDTAEACWLAHGYCSASVVPLFDAQYGQYDPGEYVLSRDNGVMAGTMVSGDKTILRAATRPGGPEIPGFASIDRYLARLRSGELTSFQVSVTGASRVADFISLEITDAAPPVLQALRPVGLRWSTEITFMSTSWGIPQPLLSPPVSVEASRSALLALFDSYGRAACVVHPSGEIIHLNAEARRVAGSHFALRGGTLQLDRPDEQARLLTALSSAATRSEGSVPVHFAMTVPNGRGPLILQVAPVDRAFAGPNAALVFLTDPAAPIRPAPVETLQLLGLTPAEARAAAMVGGGLAPKEAASRLGIAEPTIRSALRIAYQKLGITRQSELVQVVARLSFL